MRLARQVMVIVGLTLVAGAAAASEVRHAGDDTAYPAAPARWDGTEVIDRTVFMSEGVTYPGPRRAYAKPLAAPADRAAARADDTTYPTADRAPGATAGLAALRSQADGT